MLLKQTVCFHDFLSSCRLLRHGSNITCSHPDGLGSPPAKPKTRNSLNKNYIDKEDVMSHANTTVAASVGVECRGKLHYSCPPH